MQKYSQDERIHSTDNGLNTSLEVSKSEMTSHQKNAEVEALIAEYTDVFACSLSEVLLIPGARVNLNVPADAQFNTNI